MVALFLGWKLVTDFYVPCRYRYCAIALWNALLLVKLVAVGGVLGIFRLLEPASILAVFAAACAAVALLKAALIIAARVKYAAICGRARLA